MTFQTCRAVRRACVVLSLAVIMLGVSSAVALAAPYATDQYPKASTSSTTPLIGAVIGGSVGTPTVVMRLNGNVVPATLVGTTVSYVPTTPLTNGSNNTVQLEMTDSTGTSTQSWSFTVNTAPTMTFTMTPANGTSYTGSSWSTNWQSQGRMSVTASSAGVAPGSQRMWLNGAAQTVGTTPSTLTWGLTNFQLWQSGPSGYREPVNGRYQLVVAWNDINDVTRYGITQFTVNLTPGAQSPQPASGSTVLGPRPTIGAYIRGNAVTGNVRLTIDGNVVFDGPVSFPAPRGTYRLFSFTPAANLAPGPHTATMVVSTTSELGTVSSAPLNWSFTVQAPAAMSQLTTCETAGCHPTLRSAHPLGDCASCHGLPSLPAGVQGDHGDGPNCGDCHGGYHYLGVVAIPGSVACGGCHGPQNAPYVFWHTETNTASAHQTPGCDGCHTTPSSLTTLHGQYPEGDPYKYQCDTCHASADAQVQSAITSGDTSCDACHPSHGAVHDSIGLAQCAECHGTDVIDIHDSCATCHATTPPPGATCLTCHEGYDTGHGGSHASAVSAQCAECHGSDVVGLHGGACGTCHGAVPTSGQTCVTCHPSYTEGHGFPIYGGGYNANAAGYLAWSYVREQTGVTDSPHGNYATSTNKCAVCHAVHRAKKDGVVLTAWGGIGSQGTFAKTLQPFESCYFCHGTGATFTNKTVEFFVTTSLAENILSPHTTCGRCHTASPHGAGSSEFPLLASKLLNDHADAQLEYDLYDGPGAPRNGLSEAMFDLSDPALIPQGMTLGTGYLCVGCHGSATNQHVFAVNQRGATPAIHYGTENPAGHAFSSGVTGHQVWIGASSSWYNPGTWYSGGGQHDYYTAVYQYKFSDGVTRYFKVASATTFNEVTDLSGGTPQPGGLQNATTADIIAAYGEWESTIAYNNAYGCGACHDAKRADGKLAFPHGYVNAAGAPAPKWAHRTEPGAIFTDNTDGSGDGLDKLQTSFVWMTKAGDADDAKALVEATSVWNSTSQRVNIDANPDGMCLKCHLSGDRTAGVGVTY